MHIMTAWACRVVHEEPVLVLALHTLIFASLLML